MEKIPSSWNDETMVRNVGTDLLIQCKRNIWKHSVFEKSMRAGSIHFNRMEHKLRRNCESRIKWKDLPHLINEIERQVYPSTVNGVFRFRFSCSLPISTSIFIFRLTNFFFSFHFVHPFQCRISFERSGLTVVYLL